MSKFTDDMKSGLTNGATAGFMTTAMLAADGPNPIATVAAGTLVGAVAAATHRFLTFDKTKESRKSVFHESLSAHGQNSFQKPKE